MADRIQRTRAKMPEGAIYVGPGTRWFRPFIDRPLGDPDRQSSIAHYRRLFTQSPSRLRHQVLTFIKGNQGHGEAALAELKDALPDLRGHDLVCWCPLIDEHGDRVPCHADVLLELANA